MIDTPTKLKIKIYTVVFLLRTGSILLKSQMLSILKKNNTKCHFIKCVKDTMSL